MCNYASMLDLINMQTYALVMQTLTYFMHILAYFQKFAVCMHTFEKICMCMYAFVHINRQHAFKYLISRVLV